EGTDVMVGDQLRLVTRPTERLDPFCDPAVLIAACTARDLAVRDVLDEDVVERVLGFALDRPAALAAHEILPCERAQVPLDWCCLRAACCGKRACPELLPD